MLTNDFQLELTNQNSILKPNISNHNSYQRPPNQNFNSKPSPVKQFQNQNSRRPNYSKKKLPKAQCTCILGRYFLNPITTYKILHTKEPILALPQKLL